MTRVLVTGGCGFVGTPAVEKLAAAGWEVHVVSRHSMRARPPGVRHHVCDLWNAPSAAQLMSLVRPTHWLHLAWCTEPGKYLRSPENFRWLEVSVALLQGFHRAGGRRVVMAGSCAEYDWQCGVCDETSTPLRPTTPYGVAKNALRAALESFGDETGLSWAWGRVFCLYGPAERPERLVASVVRSLLQDQIAECTSGEQVRDYLHVSDAAAAFMNLLSTDCCGAVNIGSGEGVAVRDLAYQIARKMHRVQLLNLGARAIEPSEPVSMIADCKRLRGMGWRPYFTLDDGLDDVIAWWRSRQTRQAEGFRGYGLP